MSGTCAHGRCFCKNDATVAPTVDNDVTEGYTVGSCWIDVTADKTYVCVDSTEGAAIWYEIKLDDKLLTADSGEDYCLVTEEDSMASDGYLWQWFPFHGQFASAPGSVSISNISYVNCSAATVIKITKSGFILRVTNSFGLGRHECEFDWSV